ncbi:1-deoxy-D-xylulose-5-phosphate synthase N-terminal domain-containing protein [Beduinella massiliensis]|uniref:1-deoxy-D-xylulose-5-phosphate synthase N-terminal domain-containing protein n=1 Tax=Beduinella massiliensis TaxID=1852363 RepID=UPI000C855BCC
MADQQLVQRCKALAKQIRKDIIEMTYSTGNVGAHIGGSLSLAEILAALYGGIVRYEANNPLMEERDRVILSKGHGALALYPALAGVGIIQREKLDAFKQDGSDLSAHPSLTGMPGIEYASGSLGQGLSLGVGACLALRRKQNEDSRVFVILGDGECDEGSVWESAASAAHFGLNQLVAIVDENHIQYDGWTKDVMDMGAMESKWKSFGWETCVTDGHDVEALLDAFGSKREKPLVVLAQTVKGKGVSFIENNKQYHNNRLSQLQYEQALTEVEKEND